MIITMSLEEVEIGLCSAECTIKRLPHWWNLPAGKVFVEAIGTNGLSSVVNNFENAKPLRLNWREWRKINTNTHPWETLWGTSLVI